jgi:hypothetical protein
VNFWFVIFSVIFMIVHVFGISLIQHLLI